VHQSVATEEDTVDILGFRGTPRRAANAEAKIKELEDILWEAKRTSKFVCVHVHWSGFYYQGDWSERQEN
jgi:hypothetical protein